MISQHCTDRAIAYEHQKPHERAASFIKQQLHVCSKNIGALEGEIKLMWNEPTVIALLGEDTCYMKKCQAESALKEHIAEKQSWEHLYEKLGACHTCNGGGWLWESISQDESIRVTCTECKGTGIVSLKAVAAVKVAEAKKAVEEAEAEAKKPGILLALGRKFR
jgi:hypothetical protein